MADETSAEKMQSSGELSTQTVIAAPASSCTLKIAYKENLINQERLDKMIRYLMNLIKTSEVMLTTLTSLKKTDFKEIDLLPTHATLCMCGGHPFPRMEAGWLC